MNIFVTAILAAVLLSSGLPMAQAGERYRSGVILFWSKGDVNVGFVGRYGSFGHGSRAFKSRHYIHSPRSNSPPHPRWHGQYKYFGQRGRFSHHRRFTQHKPVGHPRHFKHRGHMRHGSPSIPSRSFAQRRRFGHHQHFTRQSRSGGYGHSRGFVGIR